MSRIGNVMFPAAFGVKFVMAFNRFRGSFLFFGILLCLCAAIVLVAQTRSSISGFVFGPGRTRIERAQVELINSVNSVVARVQTDSGGRFMFIGLTSGDWSIRVLPFETDYAEQTQRVELGGGGIAGKDTENVQIDINLEPRKTREAPNAAVLFAQDIPKDAQTHFDTGVSLLAANKVDDGIEELKQAITIFPTYFLSHVRLGVEYMKIEKYDDARSSFTKAAAANSRSYDSWYGLSYANFALEKFDAAIEAANKALVIEKDAPAALFVLGVSQRRIRQYDAAEKTLAKAERLDDGKLPDIHWHLVLLYAHNRNRYNDAANQLEKYLKATPTRTARISEN